MSERVLTNDTDLDGRLNISMAALTFPAFLTILMSVAYGIIDSWFLSKISDSAAAAVGGVFSFLAMSAFFLRAFAQAGGIISGQVIGANTDQNVAKTFTVSLCINIILGTLIAAAIFLLHPHIGRWLGFEYALQLLSSQYLQAASLIIFFQAMTVCYLVLLAMHGKTQWNLWVIVVLNITNISANYALIAYQHGMYFSVKSIALTSAFAQCVTLMLCMYLVHCRLKLSIDLSATRLKIREIVRKILRIAIPSSLFPVSLQLNLLALVAVISTMGTDVLATQVYTVNIIMLIVAWSTAVAQSTQIYMSRLVGALNYQAAYACYRRCLKWGVVGVLLSVTVFYLASDLIFGLLTNNHEIIELGGFILLLCFILEPFRAVNLISLSALNSAGDAKVPGLISIALMWLIGFSLSWFLGVPLGYGLVGVYIGRIIDEIIRAYLVNLRWRRGVWTLVKVEQ